MANRLHSSRTRFDPGFTIIELLIVIVVIAILALIVFVAYNGIQSRAVESGIKSDLRNASQQLADDLADQGVLPTDTSGLKASNGGKYQYDRRSNTSYCLTETTLAAGGKAFHVADGGDIDEGVCPGHLGPGEDENKGGASCSGLSSCLAVVMNKAEDYAASHDTTLAGLVASYGDQSQVDTIMTSIVSTLPGWTYAQNDAFGGKIPTDPNGNGYVVAPGQFMGINDPDVIVGEAQSADRSQEAVMIVLSGGNQVLFPSTTIDIPVADDDYPGLIHTGILFFAVSDMDYIRNAGTANITGQDLIDNNSLSSASRLFEVVSGPTGGPWTFKMKQQDATSGQSMPEALQNCTATFSAVDATHARFDGSSCW